MTSDAGTKPSAPRGRSGRGGSALGFADDITLPGVPVPPFVLDIFDAFESFVSNFRGSKIEEAALRFAAASLARPSSLIRIPPTLLFAFLCAAISLSLRAFSFFRTIRCSLSNNDTRSPNVFGAYFPMIFSYLEITSKTFPVTNDPAAPIAYAFAPPAPTHALTAPGFVPPIALKSALTFSSVNPRRRSAALRCVAPVFPNDPFPN